ncbi:MAG TPA: T9SS type A sorting domain-containing protein [Flavobacterium sp.]|nr:T9SS type A sorting domain-containing protein [Flavobacterium sp.]
MKLKLLLALLVVTIGNAQTQIGQDITGNTNYVEAIALSENGNVLAISSDNLTKVYSNISGNWTQVGQDIQGYGYRILLSNDGSTIAITNHNTMVRVYKNINNTWTQIGQDIPEDGHDIALSGDGSIIAMASTIGFPFNIYKNISGTWTVIGQIHSEGFSICLSENGDTIAACPLHPAAGISVFKNVNNNWIQVGNTINANPNDNLGFRMDMSSDGKTIAVTISNNNGSINVYRYINNNWSLLGSPIVSTVPNEIFAKNVAISGSGNVVVVGSEEGGNTGNGRVDIFEYLQGNWVKKGEITDQSGNQISWAIALSRDGNSLALRSTGSIGPKPAGNIVEEQTNTNNYEGKGASAGVRVYDIQGILSSDTFVLENFNIYPNPTTDVLNIELDNSLTLEKVFIYNTSGQLVKETTDKTINVSAFSKGVYNVQVVTNQGKATKKVIVK